MDRIDAMRVFVTALAEGSLAGAGRKLGKSPAGVSRAIAFLEAQVGVELLHRTTRTIRVSEAGEGYAVACRRILSELDEANSLASGERSAPRGVLTLTAPIGAGELLLRPIVDDFMDAHSAVSVRLNLLDRTATLIEEGIDLALRIAHLADSTLVALPVGHVRRVIVASPRYLSQHPQISEPSDLIEHQIVAASHYGVDSWSFPPLPGSVTPRTVQFVPRFIANSTRAAVGSAIHGQGVMRVFSYQVADAVKEGKLCIILAEHEQAPLPVHLVSPHGRLAVPKVRAFVDFALPALRAGFANWLEACQPRPLSRSGHAG